MIAIAWDNELGAGRWQTTSTGALAVDQSLESVVLVALFTDREADEAELRAAGLDQQQGWWAEADTVRDPQRPRMGSKLWLLSREMTTLATLRRAEAYAREALVWLIDFGIAETINVNASRPRPGVLGLEITITRPNKLLPPYKRLWEMSTRALP